MPPQGHCAVVLVLLSPGQGSQTPGMLSGWLDLPGAADHVQRWSTALDLDLAALGTIGTAEQLRDTRVAQPLLTVAALLSAGALLAEGSGSPAVSPDLVCGHSIGELPAAALAGVLSEDEAVELAGQRGAAMADAAAARPTGMAAVLGGDGDLVQQAADRHGLSVATVNVAGQVVLGGAVEALDALAADRPPGARVRRLDVAGAFHTAAMVPARDAFARALDRLSARPARLPVVANADGAEVSDGAEVLGRLAAQLTGPVRFDRCLTTIAARGATRVVELAPGGTLAGLAKRALPDAQVLALRTPDDLADARALTAGALA